MIQDAVTAALLPKQPLETRLDAVIETATSNKLGALDEDKATAKLYPSTEYLCRINSGKKTVAAQNKQFKISKN